MTKALRTLRFEHANLFSVLHCLRSLVLDPEARQRPLETEVLRAILRYIETYPDRFHHPKEERHLFAALRRRRPETAATLDRLERQHVEGAALIRTVAETFEAAVADPSRRPTFEAAVRAYVDLQRAHMATEEREILPLALSALTEEDWQSIDSAFADNDDPVFGARPRREFEALFRRIVDLAPPPFGFGDEPRAAHG